MNMYVKKYLFIPAVLFICIFLYNDISSPVIMESRNFITAREILENGSWLIPTMNGEVRVTKPPLPTWITTVPMILAGTDTNLLMNRIPAGIFALILAFFSFFLARKLAQNSEFATTTLLVIATSYLFMWMARKNEWDIYAHAAMVGALWALVEAFLRKEGKALFFVLASILMTISFLSKGPVAFWAMLFPFLASYLLTYGTQDFRANKRRLFWTFFICAILSSAWPIYVYLNIPHTATAVAAAESSAWFRKHTEPAWYYLKHIQTIVGIWIFFLLYGLAVPFLDKNRKPEEKFFVLWFFLTILSISIFPEKKPRYLLPAVVPAAMVTAMVIHRLRNAGDKAWKAVYGAFCIILGIMFIAAGGALIYLSNGSFFLSAGTAALAFTGVSLFLQFKTGNTANSHMTAVLGICFGIVFLAPIASRYLPRDGTSGFMIMRDPRFSFGPFYSLGEIEPEIIWAAGKKIQAISEPQIGTLKNESSPYALISPIKIDRSGLGLQPAGTIHAHEKTYHIYLHP